MLFSASVIVAIVASVDTTPVLSFVQPSIHSLRTTTTNKHGHLTAFMGRTGQNDSRKSKSSLQMAFKLEEGQTSNMFDGPRALVKERDACGVGMIVNTKTGEFGSHKILYQALHALDCMEHRGACGGDNESGDGAGVMTQIPWKLFDEYRSENCPKPGVGMMFFPQDEERRNALKKVIEDVCAVNELEFVGWREVPVDNDVLGPLAKAVVPSMWQFFVKAPKRLDVGDKSRDAFERTLYLVRRRFDVVRRERGLVWDDDDGDMYVASFSSRTIVYKGMVQGCILPQFYHDLRNEDFTTKFVIYHRRFSTNTTPKWPLSQPMRVLGHNGEINTLLGNVNWIKAREKAKRIAEEEGDCAITDLVDSEKSENIVQKCNTQDRPSVLEPLINLDKSDSSNLDEVFDLMCRCRHRAPCALMALVPTAYLDEPALADNPEIVDFYKFHGGLLEAWDGPALICYSDGKSIGASLDRNGLRPARYSITKDGSVFMMSETGVVPELEEADIVVKGRLGPGQMINVDLETGEFKDNIKIKSEIASRHPYGEWIANQRQDITHKDSCPDRVYDDATTTFAQSTFGWSLEDIGMQINDMASGGKETTYSMGDDAPLAVLSERPHVTPNYFKQRFAQVTNPPIDPLREGVVMSLGMTLGKKESIYKVSEKGARLIHIESPVLTAADMEQIKACENDENGGFAQATISTRYDLLHGPSGLKSHSDSICDDAVQQVQDGVEVLILSDLAVEQSVLDSSTYIPPLLAVGAVHHRLIKEGLRMDAGIIIETGGAWSTHHFASMVGYGANAVHPYLALETVKQWHGNSRTQKQMSAGKIPELTIEGATENYLKAINSGLLKILSKIGVSLLTSYSGAQIFEAVGLGQEVIDVCFKGTTSRIDGMSFEDLASETVMMRPEVADAKMKLVNYGYYKPVGKVGEYHANSASLARTLHTAIGLNIKVNSKNREKFENGGMKEATLANYEIFKQSLETAPLAKITDLLDFESDRDSIPITDVEPIEVIMKRFCTGAMSLGALSREAHETLAIAVNRVGGKSNSGEGGEDVIRGFDILDVDEDGNSETFPHLSGLKNGDSANSYVHQVASGRFGVTPEFLVTAKQLEIKMAQGAKPGEGGQLPGPKINEYIAGLRAAKQGVTLISPPPHHDIYSIEDLAQLIHDLHAIDEKAGVSVKLVASVGIGTVACGVAKANADVIQISGGDGGTGASPLSSIKHAGCPWELGLGEAHAALLDSGLRSRVVIRVDGGIRTGRDIAVAAMMGAEEFGFGTIAMIAEGCVMARVCHMNTCPVGVTSQKEELRKKFPGTPQHVVSFFEFVAGEVRELMAHLGYAKFEDLIGRADLLAPDRTQINRVAKTKSINLDSFFSGIPNSADDRNFLMSNEDLSRRKAEIIHSNGFSSDLDRAITSTEDIKKVIKENKGYATANFNIRNIDRSTCAMLSGDIARAHGNTGFKGRINLNIKGSAGQSFGAFILPGLSVRLEGEANDYVAKGMNGGELVIVPDQNAGFIASESSIVGNACLYGATGGDFHANGRAGERFAVRNSGAYAVNEGSGDHCCEYMTGGVVVVLGSVGRNVGAGMTGGIGYFYDEDDSFDVRVNKEIVKTQRINTAEGEAQLKTIIERHYEKTGSEKAEVILNNWETEVTKFWQVYPPSEAKTPFVTNEDASDMDLRVSASSLDDKMCFLPVGSEITGCAD